MTSFFDNVPVVAIYNNLETFREFLTNTSDRSVFQKRKFRGDRALFWLGETKLVFMTSPPFHLSYIQNHLGYENTFYRVPDNPSMCLSLDILKESNMIQSLISTANIRKTIQLVPYATTPEFLHLVDVLTKQYGLNVLLPESPTSHNLWIRDYIDTKSGFRLLASYWLANSEKLLPYGFVCHNLSQAQKAIQWFSQQHKTCMVKADEGEGSLGNYIIEPSNLSENFSNLQKIPSLQNNKIVVEEFIDSPLQISPSIEFYVPPKGVNTPQMTYIANQLFLESGRFAGVLISKQLLETSWFSSLYESGLLMAQKLQEMGYQGHFDLDAIVDKHEQIYLLEVNARRTGGTHVHEFAQSKLGKDYLNHFVILSTKMESGAINDGQLLLDTINNLQYPIEGQPYGIVITTTSSLIYNRFECIIIGSSTKQIISLQRSLIQQIQQSDLASYERTIN